MVIKFESRDNFTSRDRGSLCISKLLIYLVRQNDSNLEMNEGRKFLKKLWYRVVERYHKIIWFYQLRLTSCA